MQSSRLEKILFGVIVAIFVSLIVMSVFKSRHQKAQKADIIEKADTIYDVQNIENEESDIGGANNSDGIVDNAINKQSQNHIMFFLSLIAIVFSIGGITALILNRDSRNLKLWVVISIIGCSLVALVTIIDQISDKNGIDEENENRRFKARVESRYKIYVDGIEIESADDIDIMEYDAVYDDKGHKIILRSKDQDSVAEVVLFPWRRILRNIE